MYESSNRQANLNQNAFVILGQMQVPAEQIKKLAGAQTDWARIDEKALPVLLQTSLEKIDAIAAMIDRTIPFLQAAPSLLGTNEPKTYMILL